MDRVACLKASDDDLFKLGMKQRGDIIHLKGFCLLDKAENSYVEEKGQQLTTDESKKLLP